MSRIRRFSHRLSPTVWVTVILAGLIAHRVVRPPQRPAPEFFESEGPHRVERVVDGDTLLLEGGVRVRLIGVDTPETKHPDRPVEPFGKAATEFTRQHVGGKRVTLKFDRERRDTYHRILAYVYVDGWFLNEELIRAGFSGAETGFPYSPSMKRRFLKAEEAAREAGRGIWAER